MTPVHIRAIIETYMNTNRIFFVIGLLVLAVPFTGFPRFWEEWFLVIVGVLLILLASLNIWQRSIVKRLKFHSKKLEPKTDEPEIQTEDRYEENSTDYSQT